jgi:1,4-alpha-glucan branching enzyme
MTAVALASSWRLDHPRAQALADAILGDPFAVLGPHKTPEGWLVRAFLPAATCVQVVGRPDGEVLGTLDRGATDGLFEGLVDDFKPYRLRISWTNSVQETEDPYSFGLLLGDMDLHLFNEGRHFALADSLGAQVRTIDGVPGIRFAVWAPNAKRVAVVGDFNSWDPRRHSMRVRSPAGIWELFVPRLEAGERYKFDIVGPDGHRVPLKADPLARQAELAPATASIVATPDPLRWRDEAWMVSRAARHEPRAPISIYEVHLGSWFPPHEATNEEAWDEAILRLIPYVAKMGFTHVELLPVSEHPFGGSWGYQPIGLFAPTSRYGTPAGFARFVDAMHGAGIGVILDWVPAHFPNDAHGLVRFDGTALYEHLDPREGFHRDWNTLIYNFGRREVQGFLIASAVFWLETFHIDGLRVDAVASMLYRDYSRRPGEWIPNAFGGRENLEAISFIRNLNAVVAERCPGAMMIAEESTAWPGVTHPVSEGGLGFSYKWNMGWMHDTLLYMEREPVHRHYHHDDITFGLLYAFSERFILPLSHDEVVHGKRSLIGKMPGDRWQRFANLRAYFGFMWAHPGKKLLFMGGEIAQEHEWFHDGPIEWHRLDEREHAGIQRLICDLNRLYASEPALHRYDTEARGFRWVIGDDVANSVFAFLRLAEESVPPILAVCNMTPVVRHDYRIGVPSAGRWDEIFNSDSHLYAGSNQGNGGAVETEFISIHGERQSVSLVLPPLAVLLLKPRGLIPC